MDSQHVKTLTKLQAFIDQALGLRAGAPGAPGAPGVAGVAGKSVNPTDCTTAASVSVTPSFLAATTATEGDRRMVDFLRMAIDDTPEYRSIASSLRRTEAYSMVSFLLQEGEGEKVEDLSARYGISAGHFRRIFRAELGGSPKSALNDWRLAKAVLAVIERQHSLTEVAMTHGFASPSHFSSEVKKSLGLSLTHLFDALKKQ